jgi:hypothetical protein
LPGIASTCIASYAPGFTGSVLAPGALPYINKAAFTDPPACAFGNRRAPRRLAWFRRAWY